MKIIHPVEAEVEHTTDDPYVSAVEDAASGEPVLTEAPPPETPMEPLREATTSISTGFGGWVQVIPAPIVPEVPSAKAGPVIKSTETASKETKETVPSGPPNPAAQPIEAEASKPPSGEPESSKPPSGEPETSKSTATASTSGNPETTPKAKAKSVSMRKSKAKEPPKETPEQKEEREKAERTAEELVQQEAEEKKKQLAKDAKSKKAAAKIQRRPARQQLSSVKLKSKLQKVSKQRLRKEDLNQLFQITNLRTTHLPVEMINLGKYIITDLISKSKQPWNMKEKQETGSDSMTLNQHTT